jgi:PAS domain S-box-containing protein
MTALFIDRIRRYYELHRVALRGALLVLILSLFIWQRVGNWYEAELLADKRETVTAELIPYGNALTTALNGRFALLRGLQAFTQSETAVLKSDFADEFTAFATGLYDNASSIRNISIAPNGVQEYVYPLEGNENVLGHNLLQDEQLNVRANVQQAIETKSVILSDPYELRQGGLGLVLRQAIYQDGDFWGLVAIVLNVPPILAEAGLEGGNSNLMFALQDDKGVVFFGDSALFENNPVIYSVELPEEKWELAAVPVSGWQVATTSSLLLIRGSGLLLVLLATLLAYLIVDRQARLDSAVEQKKRELVTSFQALHESESRYKTLFDEANDAIFVSNMQGELLDVNQRACKQLGYRYEELRSMTLQDILAPKYADILRQRMDKLVELGHLVFESGHLHRNGSFIPVELNATMFEYQGQTAVLGIARNLTKRHIIEDALRRSEARYRNIFQTTAVSIWEEDFTKLKAAIDAVKAKDVIDFRAYLNEHPEFVDQAVRQVKILNVNKATLKMFEAQSKEDLLNSLDRTFVPESLDDFREELIAIAEGHPHFAAEAVIQTLQGERVDIFITITFPTGDSSWDNVTISMIDITERKQAERALERSSFFFKAVIEQSKEGIVLTTVEGDYVMVNPAFCQMTGYSQEELLSMNILDLLPANPNFILFSQVAIIKKQKGIYILQLQRKDGSNFYAEINGSLIDLENEHFNLDAVRDINERIWTETELENHARQQAAVAQLGQRALANPPLISLFDEAVMLVAKTLEAEYCKVLELLPGGETMLLQAGVGWQEGLVGKAVVDTGLDSQAGFTLLTDEPVIVTDLTTDVRFNGPALLTDHGVISGMSTIIRGEKRPYGILGIHTAQYRLFSQDDVNFLQTIANLLAEAVARQQAEATLKESEERYRLLADMSPDGIALHRHGKLLYVNDSLARLLGANSTHELLGRATNKIVHPDYWETANKWAERIIAGEQEPYPVESLYVRLDGTTVPIDVTAVPLQYQGKMAMQAIVRDISQRKQAEAELEQYRKHLETLVAERTAELKQRVAEVEQLNAGMVTLLSDLQAANEHVTRTAQQLEESNVELESFAYSVSHDLRAPLRHISGFVTMLQKKERDKLDEKSTHYLQVITEAATRMGQLIDDLLNFSRTSRQALVTHPVDVNKLVAEARQELASDVKNRDIVWEIETLPTVTADFALLRQVWVNLLENAIKYTAPRLQAHIKIGVLPSSEDNEITFFICDNGVGFDEKYIDKLFGVFQRLHRDEYFAGTGIGLATVRRIVHRHNGRTWAEGKIGKGATFYFTLPT